MEKIKQYIIGRRAERDKKSHLIINIFVGIFTFILCVMLENSTWGHKNINLKFDAFLKQEAYGVNDYKDRRIAPEIVFFDIDDATYRAWGRPALTPRDKLAELVGFAYHGGAKVIVLDISFEEKDHNPPKQLPNGKMGLDGRQRDWQLEQMLRSIKASGGETKVILPAGVYADQTLRPNIFAELVDDTVIFQALPATAKDRYDSVTRYWVPFKKYKDGKEEPHVLWSSPLLAVVLAKGSKEELDGYGKALAANCTVAGNQTLVLHTTGPDQKIQFSTEEGYYHQYNRIRFLLLPEKSLTAWGTLSAVNQRKVSSGETVFTTTLPEFSLKGKIVIIGNSSTDCDDMHMTPVGPIPGMYIQGNAVNTLMQGNQTTLPPLLVHYIFEFIIIFGASVAFWRYNSLLDKMLITLLLFVILLLLYYLYQYTGIFVNMVFPVVGIGIREFYMEVEHLVKELLAKKESHAKND